MRIMQLYRIESEYKSHKKRLSQIKNTNSLEKIKRVTHQQFYVTNQLKKIKLQDQSFQQREEISRREHTQSLMNKTLHDNFKKIKAHYQPYPTISHSNSKTLKHSPRNSDKEQNSNNQFAYLKFKIDKMKSQYRKSRKNPQDTLKPDKQKSKKEMVDLLKQQFKLQSKVVFPRCKTKTINNDMNRLPSQSQQQSKKQHLKSIGSSDKI